MSAASMESHDLATPRLTFYREQGLLVMNGIDDVIATMVESDVGPVIEQRFNAHEDLVAALRALLHDATHNQEWSDLSRNEHDAMLARANAVLAKVAA